MHSLLESVELEPSTSVYIDESQTRKRIYVFVPLKLNEDLRSLPNHFFRFIYTFLEGEGREYYEREQMRRQARK